MSFYYLELNPLVSLGNRLPELCKLGCTVYTSVWAISELLINISERNFDLIKSRLNIIYKSGISIDWENPLYIIYLAFNINRTDLDIESITKEIIEAINTSRSYSEFESKHTALYNELEIYRQARIISDQFIKKTNTMILENVAKVDNDKLSEYDFENIFISGLINNISIDLNINRQYLLEMYSGRLHWYLSALKMITVNMKELDKNDYFDVMHFLYIQNEATYLVSNDSIFSRLKFKKAISYWDFIKRVKFVV